MYINLFKCSLWVLVENKDFYVNPNAGFASVIQFAKEKLIVIGVLDSDHIERGDEHEKLINPEDFPRMMFVTSFIRHGLEEALFIPAKVERDEHKKVTKIDVLLKDPEHDIPEVYNKLSESIASTLLI
ncbi:hypothetical protein BV898_03969 [Hypsibius exemplaris]|uniref:Uncharacterized protein n=1 Tax=Hypsibius exemplaris TaxID=2072580 RepID=A0A1W0X3Q9_HYPEX|nr:hypothetical protein BV898_03969 [Hypsibius exemplaris]